MAMPGQRTHHLPDTGHVAQAQPYSIPDTVEARKWGIQSDNMGQPRDDQDIPYMPQGKQNPQLSILLEGGSLPHRTKARTDSTRPATLTVCVCVYVCVYVCVCVCVCVGVCVIMSTCGFKLHRYGVNCFNSHRESLKAWT